MPKGKQPAPGALESQGPAKPMERYRAALPPTAFDATGKLNEEGIALAAAMDPIMPPQHLPPMPVVPPLDSQGRFVNPTLEGIAIAQTAASLPDPTAAPGPSGVAKDWEKEVGDLDQDIEFPG